MKVYLITYDLNNPHKDYSSLYEKIKSLGRWWHYLDSTWIVATRNSSSQINDILKAVLDSDDGILVIEVKNDYNGWLPEEAWDWMRQNISVSNNVKKKRVKSKVK